MKTAILISGHYLGSKRKAGFHWIADALWRAGWRVIFVTAPVSWLSWVRRDHRHQYPIREEANRLTWLDEHLGSYVWWTPWHPANLRSGLLDRLAQRLFRRYHELPLGPLEEEVKVADLFVFESTPALPLFERFRSLNPAARAVYRVSDDLQTINAHPMLHEVERRLAPHFDLVSSPTRLIHDKFEHLPNARLHPHGVAANLYDAPCPCPYEPGDGLDLVFVGISRFDARFLEVASRVRPDARFHVVGPIRGLPRRENVFAYGEMAFEETIPYVRHADIGLHTLERSPGVEVFADSLKVMQYSWCRLPIIAPCFLQSSRPNVVCYDTLEDETVSAVIAAAAAMRPDERWRTGIRSWDDVARTLAGAAPRTTIETHPIVMPPAARVGA